MERVLGDGAGVGQADYVTPLEYRDLRTTPCPLPSRRIRMNHNYLFAGRDFFEVRDSTLQRLQKEIATASTETLAEAGFTEKLKRKYEFRRIELDTAHAADAPAEGPNGSIVVTLSVPFTGTLELFSCQASQYTLNPQQGSATADKPGSSYDGHVTLTYQSQDADPEQYKQWKATELAALELKVGWINTDVVTHYGAMAQAIERGVAERKEQLAKLDAFKKGIA